VSKLERHVPFSWRHVAFWGGLRGALAIAMVLSLPQDFPEREMLLSATFSVVLFTIVIQGVSMEHLVRRLKLREAR
jgi:CPA1 family monovalent cation:H+ antiporter